MFYMPLSFAIIIIISVGVHECVCVYTVVGKVNGVFYLCMSVCVLLYIHYGFHYCCCYSGFKCQGTWRVSLNEY